MLVLSIAAYAVSMPLAQRPRTQKPQIGKYRKQLH